MQCSVVAGETTGQRDPDYPSGQSVASRDGKSGTGNRSRRNQEEVKIAQAAI
jgi:hypothetical protein